MANLTELAQRLASDYSVASGEYSDPTLKQWVVSALLAHNASYSSDASDLPAKEEQLVLKLAGISLFMARASAASKEGDLRNATGYGQDRNSPYYKCVDAAKRLQSEYTELCRQMGVVGNTVDSNTVMQGVIYKRDSMIDAHTPYDFGQGSTPPPVLSLLNKTATTVSLSWTRSRDSSWCDSYLLYRVGTSLLDPTNNESPVTGIPGTDDAAIVLKNYTNPDILATKLTGLVSGTTYYFAVANKNRQNRYVISNELSVTTP